MSDDIYREIILDHYRNPRNKGKLENADVTVHDSNPLCGDEIDIHLKVDDGVISDVIVIGGRLFSTYPEVIDVTNVRRKMPDYLPEGLDSFLELEPMPRLYSLRRS